MWVLSIIFTVLSSLQALLWILGLVHRDVARLVSLTCTLQVRRSEPPVLHPDRTGDAGPARATPKPVLRPPAEGDRFADPQCVSARRLRGL